MRILLALVSGLVFGLGLTISGMINPQKVIGFLDVAGAWDPTLIFVMGSALAVTTLGYKLVFRRAAPVCDTAFHLPEVKAIDRELVAGSLLFGIGWGLAGFCPGPAITALATGAPDAAWFVGAMLGGILLKRLVLGRA